MTRCSLLSALDLPLTGHEAAGRVSPGTMPGAERSCGRAHGFGAPARLPTRSVRCTLRGTGFTSGFGVPPLSGVQAPDPVLAGVHRPPEALSPSVDLAATCTAMLPNRTENTLGYRERVRRSSRARVMERTTAQLRAGATQIPHAAPKDGRSPAGGHPAGEGPCERSACVP